MRSRRTRTFSTVLFAEGPSCSYTSLFGSDLHVSDRRLISKTMRPSLSSPVSSQDDCVSATSPFLLHTVGLPDPHLLLDSSFYPGQVLSKELDPSSADLPFTFFVGTRLV